MWGVGRFALAPKIEFDSNQTCPVHSHNRHVIRRMHGDVLSMRDYGFSHHGEG